ncbi:MAG: hypothetical protein LCH51_10355 [Bacteroidetes bacterium]|nr:hypothetical protein [Bacteroidota bacterium]
MKTILIPTDFSDNAFSQVEQLLSNSIQEKVKLVFFHAFKMPESEQDLLGDNAKPHSAVLNETFRKGCVRLKEKFPAISQIAYRYMYGDSRSVLQHFINHNDISHLFLPEGITVSLVNPRSVDITNKLIATGLPVIQPIREQLRVRFQPREKQAIRLLETTAS